MEDKVNREHKASVFSMLFSDPTVLRELYSAIEGVDLPPDIQININTLQDVLIKGKLNDVSFLIDNRLIVLIEHQSTICENMPLRMLIYLSEVYKRILDQKKMFQRKLLKVPRPEFIVLYNGIDLYDDYKELRLSDAFKDIEGLKTKELPPMDLTVKVYNINKGHNSDMVRKSRFLDGYSLFIDKIREYQNQGLDIAESIKLAVNYCLENNILAEFLSKYKGDIMNTLIQDLTTEEWKELHYEEGLEDGREERNIEIARNMKKANESIDKISLFTGLSSENIKDL